MNAKNPKKAENTIILKGRTIRRPANQYHYILENDSNRTISENSDESDDQMFFLQKKNLFYFKKN